MSNTIRAKIAAIRRHRADMAQRAAAHRADMAQWATATTLLELGQCNALWLEGRLKSQPGYTPGAGPDPETLDIREHLAVASRAGYFTRGSQPGVSRSVTWDNSGPFVQRAAVDGYADDTTTGTLARLADRHGLYMTYGKPDWSRRSYRSAMPCTYDPGTLEVFTTFGALVSRRGVKFLMDSCSPEATDAVLAAWQVTIIDLEPGRNDRLWPALRELVERA